MARIGSSTSASARSTSFRTMKPVYETIFENQVRAWAMRSRCSLISRTRRASLLAAALAAHQAVGPCSMPGARALRVASSRRSASGYVMDGVTLSDGQGQG
jgi:hypothetical protein